MCILCINLALDAQNKSNSFETFANSKTGRLKSSHIKELDASDATRTKYKTDQPWVRTPDPRFVYPLFYQLISGVLRREGKREGGFGRLAGSGG